MACTGDSNSMRKKLRYKNLLNFAQKVVDKILGFRIRIEEKVSNIQSSLVANTKRVRAIKKAPLLIAILILMALIPLFCAVEYGHGLIGRPKSNLGGQRVIVLPIYYPNLFPSTSELEINQLMQQADEYYQDVSYGKTWLEWTIHHWILLENNAEYYGQDAALDSDTDSILADQMVMEAVRKVDATIDFNDFDRLVIFHAGYGMQSSGSNGDSARSKWLSTCHRPVHILTGDNVMINSVSIVAEFEGTLSQLGVLVHELGHDFGADDLYYDNDMSTPEELDVEDWCLMSSGNWLDGQRTPCHMCLYSKLDIGFLDESQIVPTQNGTYTFEINAISEASDGFYGARYYLTNDERVYYLVEARKQTGFDSFLEQAGVLISIINETRDSQDGRVLIAKDDRYPLENRAYGPGEYFIDELSGFGLSVLNETENGYTICVSTESNVEFRRQAMISTFLDNPQIESGSTIATDNGSHFMAVHGFNGTAGIHQVSVFESSNGGDSWIQVLSTPIGVNRTNPVLVVHRIKANTNPLSIVTRDKVYLICESQYAENHTIEVWDLEDGLSYNITEWDIDARNPSCVSSSRMIYLVYEIHNTSDSNWNPGERWVALGHGYGFESLQYSWEYIYNASQPYLSALSIANGEPEEPYLTYLSGVNQSSEVWTRPFNDHIPFLVYESPNYVTNPSIAVNSKHTSAMIVFENCIDATNLEGVYVALNITDRHSPSIRKQSIIPIAGSIHKSTLVSWGISPFNSAGFFVAFRNDSMICMLINDQLLDERKIESHWTPIPSILSTHLRTLRWTSPMLCELESDTCFVHRLEFNENGFYRYSPIWTPDGTRIEIVIVPVMVFLSLSLVSSSILVIAIAHIQKDSNIYSAKIMKRIAVLALAALFGITVNYIFAFLFSSRLVFYINLVIEIVFAVGTAKTVYDILSDAYNDDNA